MADVTFGASIIFRWLEGSQAGFANICERSEGGTAYKVPLRVPFAAPGLSKLTPMPVKTPEATARLEGKKEKARWLAGFFNTSVFG